MKYQFAQGRDYPELERHVNNQLQNGWKPYGEPQYIMPVRQNQSTHYWIQALTHDETLSGLGYPG